MCIRDRPYRVETQVELWTLFKNKVAKTDVLVIAVRKTTFSCHNVIYEQSFRSTDCQCKLITNLYDPKFSSPRTASEEMCIRDRFCSDILIPYSVLESSMTYNKIYGKLFFEIQV